MKLFSSIAALLLFVLITGCSKEEEKEIKTTAPVAFKVQLEAAKQVGSVLQDAAAQQQQAINGQAK
ncbi:MAG: hypothetical protein Q8N96_02695 [Methylovulum sp.]|nr:hypothetical protein [Methylovulum sp.]